VTRTRRWICNPGFWGAVPKANHGCWRILLAPLHDREGPCESPDSMSRLSRWKWTENGWGKLPVDATNCPQETGRARTFRAIPATNNSLSASGRAACEDQWNRWRISCNRTKTFLASHAMAKLTFRLFRPGAYEILKAGRAHLQKKSSCQCLHMEITDGHRRSRGISPILIQQSSKLRSAALREAFNLRSRADPEGW